MCHYLKDIRRKFVGGGVSEAFGFSWSSNKMPCIDLFVRGGESLRLKIWQWSRSYVLLYFFIIACVCVSYVNLSQSIWQLLVSLNGATLIVTTHACVSVCAYIHTLNVQLSVFEVYDQVKFSHMYCGSGHQFINHCYLNSTVNSWIDHESSFTTQSFLGRHLLLGEHIDGAADRPATQIAWCGR